MGRPARFAFLRLPESPLGGHVLELLGADAGRLVDMDARALSVAPGGEGRAAVEWGGVRLDQLDAVLVESAFVPWPQPLGPFRHGEAPDASRARREDRALRVSALRLVARDVRVVNDPTRASDLALSPALALERLAGAMPTVPWSVRANAGAPGRRLSPVAERGLRAPGGALALCLDVAHADAVLVVGGEAVARERRTDLAQPGAPGAHDPATADLARRAAAHLGLDVAVVHVTVDRVAAVEASPDLCGWGERHGEPVPAALARLLSNPPLRVP